MNYIDKFSQIVLFTTIIVLLPIYFFRYYSNKSAESNESYVQFLIALFIFIILLTIGLMLLSQVQLNKLNMTLAK
jgi:multisubunit Na+/H+ antiporter MnhB subunit